jgi:hypothetical protein
LKTVKGINVALLYGISGCLIGMMIAYGDNPQMPFFIVLIIALMLLITNITVGISSMRTKKEK